MSAEAAGVIADTLKALQDQYRAVRRQLADRDYMIAALVPMLGPKAREVWERWQRDGVQRIHSSWAPGAEIPTGEAQAELQLKLQDAIDGAELVMSVDGPGAAR